MLDAELHTLLYNAQRTVPHTQCTQTHTEHTNTHARTYTEHVIGS